MSSTRSTRNAHALKVLGAEWHERLAFSCRDLAALSQAAGGLEPLIKDGNVDSAQAALKRCVDIANHLSERLNELKRQARQC